MCRSNAGDAADRLTGALDALAGQDVAALDDQALREQLLDLATCVNRVQAELARRVDVFDRRGLAEPDGFRTAKSWLQGFGRLSAQAAGRLVTAARLLRRLPKLAAVAQAGDASPEHVQQVVRLAARLGAEPVAEVEATLAEAAQALDPGRFQQVCDRAAAHLDPDGPDPARDMERRSLTLTASGGMLLVRGLLDPEGGAAVATALDALMTPPGDGDERTPAQRRADALAELARRQLAAGTLPSVGGQRPQVGVLLHPQALSPQTLARLAEWHRADAAVQRLHELATGALPQTGRDWTRPGVELDRSEQVPASLGRTSHHLQHGLDSTGSATPTAATAIAGSQTSPREQPGRAGPAPPQPRRSQPGWAAPGWADPPWLTWIGAISPPVAQRIACDADIWRIILDPANGMPLDVGRAHRLVPHWIRRALHARDRGCRWPGCPTPAEWTDAHHLDPWADGGHTSTDRCLLLCRHHHGLIHETGWTIDLHPDTGQVTITRPNGTPYQTPATITSWNGPTSHAM